ncbi:membrane protein [Aeromicrobium flavum]|uniref:Membrane protein n=1 Tax=Aeromicrobium flavum TaxID=416568 RepID=A0A512HY08_9ACTN|nr:acyltransferase family protein [Aeromicrobium flavum]GEO90339.1 membrane protein [Aeromicrobium flavum]
MRLEEQLAPTQGSRSSALDGARGYAVLVLLAYHFGVEALQGAWVGLNLFFVFSGYVIVMILLKEHARFGRVSVLDFYRRRARRLLPALTLLILAVGTWAVVAADHATRRPMKDDILATVGFVMNWRLVSQADQYFAEFGNPSFFRHVWTLSVEEQFYIVAPIAAVLLVRMVGSRALRVGIILAVAVASAVWTAQIGLATAEAQAHAYYGTDTRIQALLAGMAMAFAVGPDREGRRPRQMSPRTAGLLAWTATLVTTAGFFLVPPMAPLMFERGGMLALSLLTALGIAGIVQVGPGPYRRIFTWGPLVYLGILTYGLYLWHWPVKLWLDRYAADLPVVAELLVGSVVTLAVAALSFHLVEVPVMRGGLGRLTGSLRKGRVLAVAATAVVLVLAFRVGAVPTVQEDLAAGRIPELTPETAPYEPGSAPLRVAIYGDSVPYYLSDGFPADRYPDLELTNLAVEGCGLLPLTTYWSPGYREPVKPECRASREEMTERLRDARADVLVLMVGTDLGTLHERDDGTLIGPDDPELGSLVDEQLDDLRAAAEAAGVRQVQVATLPCREVSVERLPSPPFDRDWMREHTEVTRNLAEPDRANRWLTEWAKGTDTPVLDLNGALGCDDGFRRQINGITLFRDALHFSDEAAPMLWTWLAPAVRDAWDELA